MNIVVVGTQWGDEGKGKIIDYLAHQADVVIRYSGGENAGHRIQVDGQQYDFHLVPSGLLNDGSKVLLGTGMVVNPQSLFHELETLRALGVDWEGRVFISDRTHLVLPGYRNQDLSREKSSARPIGTTGKGIGIAYGNKALRLGVRIADLDDLDSFSHLSREEREFLEEYRPALLKMTVNMMSFLRHMKGKRCLFEGAQGVLLDLDMGTYPYVTSSSTTLAGVFTGGGLHFKELHKVIGVCKPYCTRVGNGPFPTEFRSHEDKLLQQIRTIGHEFGVTTGRPRRCGYLDLIALKHAVEIANVTSLAITHLDVLDSFDKIAICLGYEDEDTIVEDFPASVRQLERVQPVLKYLDGWKESIEHITDYQKLPANARAYLSFIEDYVGIPVSLISVGSARQQTIIVSPPWE